MTIEEVRKLRAEAEAQVLAILRKLEADTGARVGLVDPERNFEADDRTLKGVRLALNLS